MPLSAPPRIERVVLRRVRSPLRAPYRLALGAVEAFDTVLVEAVTASGGRGFGEGTVLPGYTAETVGEAWEIACATGPDLVAAPLGDALARAARLHRRAPFTATALATALEMASGHPLLAPGGGRRVALLAGVNATEPEALADEVERHLEAGFATLKVKVGFDVAGDLRHVARVQARVAGRARIRIDANQGYRVDDAIAFVRGLDPEGVELVEQTCAAGDWPAAVAVADAARERGIAVMLDESIFGPDDIDRAADLGCADVVKLKLMKTGGLEALARDLARIRARGMAPVLGNGVAGDVGCWMEACVAARLVPERAGEMNGFLRPRTRLFAVPMRLEAGALVLEAGEGAPGVTPDEEAIAAHTLERRDVFAPAGAGASRA